MYTRSLWRGTAVACSFALCLAGCVRHPDAAKRDLLRKGNDFAAQKNYADAVIEYKRAIQIDPKFTDAYYQLGQAYIASGDVRNALPAYIRAADLDPSNIEANLKAGNLLLVARHFQDAKARARNILVANPNNVPGLILLGNSLAGLESLDDAIEVAQKVAKLDVDRPGAESNLGVLELAKGNVPEAETAFRRAVARDPKGVAPRLALANFLDSVGRHDEAESELREALAIDPSNPRANQTLGMLLIAVNRAKEAEPFLRVATERAGTLQAKLSLADYYLSIGKLDECLALLNKVSSTGEGFAAGRTREALIYYASGKHPEAHKALAEVLARDPRNSAALAVEGRLLLSEHRVDEALALANAALAADPHSAQAYMTIGQVQLARRSVEDARKSFAEALRNDPSRVDAQIELSKIHYERSEFDTSIDYAEHGVNLDPTNLEAHLALVRSLSVRPDDLPRAQREMQFLLTHYPKVADVQAANGALLMARNDPAGARRAFTRALEINPTQSEALQGLTALDFSAGKPAEARVRVENLLATLPKPSPDILLLAAKVYTATQQPDKTEAALRHLVEADPANLESYNLLGQFYVMTHRLPEARAEFTQIAEKEPKAPTPHTMLGFIDQAMGDVDGAKRAYEAAMQANPRAGAAANNLAWLYATTGGNLDGALALAQTARGQYPNSPEVLDTLAYVYYKKDMPGFAIPLLTQIVDKDATNPLFQFHLGLVYAKAGEDAKARAALNAALKLNPRFAGAEEARRVLATLIY